MKKYLFIIFFLFFSISAEAQHIRVTSEGQHPLRHRADRILTDITDFDGNLSATDLTVQIALETLDELTSGGGSAWDIDINGNLMPAVTVNTDDYWELDGNNDLQPKN